MDFTNFFAFVTVAALVVASSILTVSSINFVSSLGTRLFELAPASQPGFYRYGDDSLQELRLSFCNFPRKVFTLYVLGIFGVFIICILSLFFLDISNDAVPGKGKPEVIILLREVLTEWFVPAIIIYFVGFPCYIVSQSRSFFIKFWQNAR